jgi:hypothetical protein
MLANCVRIIVVGLVVCVLVPSFRSSIAVAGSTTSAGRRGTDRTTEDEVLRELHLSKDVSNEEIIRLLEDPNKSIYATLLIRGRRISAAIPSLLQIVNDDKRMIPEKLMATEALCDLGNRDWIKRTKQLVTDPNSRLSVRDRIYVAGILAKAQDYSQLGLIAGHIADKEDGIRSAAVYALENFAHETDPATISAADLLRSSAASDSTPRIREYAVRSLSKIVERRPEVKSKLIDAAKANAGSGDIGLRGASQAMLKKYAPETAPDGLGR